MARKSNTPTAPDFDFAALNAVDVDELPKGTRKSKVDETPFTGWLAESYETGTAKAVTVPESNAKQVQNLVRSAAARLEIGSRMRVKDNGDGSVTVTFKGSDKRAHKSRK